MTQRDKLGEARILAMTMKSVASGLRYDAKDYGCRFPIEHAKRLEEAADRFLKLK